MNVHRPQTPTVLEQACVIVGQWRTIMWEIRLAAALSDPTLRRQTIESMVPIRKEGRPCH